MQTKIIEENKPKEEKQNNYKILTNCPYCKTKIIKKGIRKKKFENIQKYYCKNCDKYFSSQITKNKTYPLKIIIDAITSYNRLYPIDKIPELIKDKYGINITSRIISDWLKDYNQYAPFSRMRDFVSKKYSKKEAIEESKLIHQQIYDFKYHRAKSDLILNEEFRHYKFKPLREFLELAAAECPHQIFQSPARRCSEFKTMFNLDQVQIVPKNNTAVKVANFVMQAVSNNKMRHEVLQDFMFSNDTVTVAIEIPVLLNSDDIKHYKHQLNFEIPITLKDEEYITGHIDLIQIRNGLVYIMDFKPSASKAKPIEQLTIYALALSRLTGIRLYHIRCAWFDDKNYYEFFPLHVVYKLKKRKRIPREQRKLT
ncbi:PD-(D/E)XK nuclease family protein [Candidatus Parcubacteria bacterium]|nr:PD-(D/E)XK nuclease family protein [Patescibacteria group bacterium]MCG2700531.1 PD-(D/E)XK nuclease family protein [Candidatus Parcubacteria bacterium]